MATYPDTNLVDGEVDPLYGGESSRRFGGKAWDWVANSIYEIQSQIVSLRWKPYVQRKMMISTAGVAGDVVFEYLSGSEITYTLITASAFSVYYLSYDPDDTPRVGILAEACSAGAKALVITEGPGIPPAIHGLAAGTASYVAMDTSTGRLFRTTGAYTDIVVGTINTKGYVRLFPRTSNAE